MYTQKNRCSWSVCLTITAKKAGCLSAMAPFAMETVLAGAVVTAAVDYRGTFVEWRGTYPTTAKREYACLQPTV